MSDDAAGENALSHKFLIQIMLLYFVNISIILSFILKGKTFLNFNKMIIYHKSKILIMILTNMDSKS